MNYYKNDIKNVRGDTFAHALIVENLHQEFDSIYFTCRESLNDTSQILFQKSLYNGITLIEYDAEKDKLVLCTLYGEIIEIDVEDYLELKDNFFTDNMLLFTYKTKENKTKKVKLGYCSNRDEIRNNIRKIRE